MALYTYRPQSILPLVGAYIPLSYTQFGFAYKLSTDGWRTGTISYYTI